MKAVSWPLDCDINLHLTNSRYFALCDLARTYLLGQMGILAEVVRRNWLPVVQSQEATFIRPIDPFQRFEVCTRLLYWDEKYFYIEHRFVKGETLCAILHVRAVIRCGRVVVPVSDVVALTGVSVEAPVMPAAIAAWQALLDAKKEKADAGIK